MVGEEVEAVQDAAVGPLHPVLLVAGLVHWELRSSWAHAVIQHFHIRSSAHLGLTAAGGAAAAVVVETKSWKMIQEEVGLSIS